MNSKSILISIVISTRGKSWEILSKTLDSIISSTFRDYEIVLVDQNNNDEIKKKISGSPIYKDIIYIPSDEEGLSRGRNKGFRHSKGKWLIFFDDDAILPEDAFQSIAQTLTGTKDDPRIFYGNVLTLETGQPYIKRTVLTGEKVNLLSFDTVCSISLIFSRGALQSVGGFDEELGAGTKLGAGEETDIVFRAMRKGIEIRSLKDFTVYHPEAEASIDLGKRRSYGMGLGAVYRKHIFSSPYYFIALGIKFICEMMLRVILIIINSGSPLLRGYHSAYLAGFVKGLFTKRPDR